MVSTVASEHIGPSLYDGGIEVLIASLGPEPTRKRILDNWFHLCALKDEKLIGVVVVRPPSHLYHLFVVSDLQRQGIGGQLFAAADAATIANSQSRILTVNSSLNAVPVYERLGFTVDGPVVETNGVRHQSMVRLAVEYQFVARPLSRGSRSCYSSSGRRCHRHH